MEFVKPPPPIRRLPVEDAEAATQVLPPSEGPNGNGAGAPQTASGFTTDL